MEYQGISFLRCLRHKIYNFCHYVWTLDKDFIFGMYMYIQQMKPTKVIDFVPLAMTFKIANLNTVADGCISVSQKNLVLNTECLVEIF